MDIDFGKLRIGVAMTGSFCTVNKVITELEKMVLMGPDIYCILSSNVSETDTKFGSSKDLMSRLVAITGNQIITRIAEAEPIGPGKMLDVLVVAPCTGNTISKITNGITDTSVTMSCKAHLRNQRPLVIAISTNDGLGVNAKNIGMLLNMKNIYLVPFGQDDPVNKPSSLISNVGLIIPTIMEALNGNQLQPVLTSINVQ